MPVPPSYSSAKRGEVFGPNHLRKLRKKTDLVKNPHAWINGALQPAGKSGKFPKFPIACEDGGVRNFDWKHFVCNLEDETICQDLIGCGIVDCSCKLRGGQLRPVLERSDGSEVVLLGMCYLVYQKEALVHVIACPATVMSCYTESLRELEKPIKKLAKLTDGRISTREIIHGLILRFSAHVFGLASLNVICSHRITQLRYTPRKRGSKLTIAKKSLVDRWRDFVADEVCDEQTVEIAKNLSCDPNDGKQLVAAKKLRLRATDYTKVGKLKVDDAVEIREPPALVSTPAGGMMLQLNDDSYVRIVDADGDFLKVFKYAE
ncbi:ribosomal RNA assembly protein krr1 [Perkinsus chesapeaki]|uniref:Ribosomal RNA assembly protein krr1 n=1 Tax=Perkinsus chesapeaki TaxID=330153 RepID=A0A7J6KWA8_PERCH|nr:ribosomal RNA assembly protein krr1 [Perkinsus chesapeaki]